MLEGKINWRTWLLLNVCEQKQEMEFASNRVSCGGSFQMLIVQYETNKQRSKQTNKLKIKLKKGQQTTGKLQPPATKSPNNNKSICFESQ